MRRIMAWGFALLVVGATLFFSIWSHQGFGAVDLSTVEYEKRSRNIDKAFHSVEITELADDVHIEPSPDGTCRVEYTDSSLSYHKISVESGCLVISRETKDRGKWYENIGIHTDMEEHLLVLYLPEAEYWHDVLKKRNILTQKETMKWIVLKIPFLYRLHMDIKRKRS